MNNINFDTATVKLDNTKQTDKITLHLEVQDQDVKILLTEVGKPVPSPNDPKVPSIPYNPIGGGFIPSQNILNQQGMNEEWPKSGPSGQIPEPKFGNTPSGFVIVDPSVPNPKFVDQMGLVPQPIHLMKVDVEEVLVNFNATKVDGNEAPGENHQKVIGYLGKFLSADGTLHTIFIDGGEANNRNDAVSTIKGLALDTKNWDNLKSSPTLVKYLEEQHLNFEKLGDIVEDGQQGTPSLKQDLTNPDAAMRFYFNPDGTFKSIRAFNTNLITSAMVSEGNSQQGLQLIIQINENPQHGIHTNGNTLEQDLSSVLNSGELPSGMQSLLDKLNQANFDLSKQIGLEVFEEIKDENLLTQSTSSAHAPSSYTPTLVDASGHHVTLNAQEFEALTKMLLMKTHNITPNTPYADFVKDLKITIDPTNGEMKVEDTSNGKYGLSVDLGKSRLDFTNNPMGYNIYINKVDNDKFHSKVLLDIKTSDGDIVPNLGQLNYDPNLGVWTPLPFAGQGGLVTPHELTDHNSKVEFVPVDATKPELGNQLVMTTDGTFTPESTNDLVWTKDPVKPNVWIGKPTQTSSLIMFKNSLPTTDSDLVLAANSLRQQSRIVTRLVNVLESGYPLLVQPKDVDFTKDLYTGKSTLDPNQNIDTLTSMGLNGHNMLSTITFTNTQTSSANLVPSVDNVKEVFAPGFELVDKTVETVGDKVVYTITGTPSVKPITPLTPSANLVQDPKVISKGNYFANEIKVDIKNEHGKIIATGKIIQDPVTMKYALIDKEGNPFKFAGNIQTLIKGISGQPTGSQHYENGFLVNLLGKDKNNFEFKKLELTNVDGTKSATTLFGDSSKSTI